MGQVLDTHILGYWSEEFIYQKIKYTLSAHIQISSIELIFCDAVFPP